MYSKQRGSKVLPNLTDGKTKIKHFKVFPNQIKKNKDIKISSIQQTTENNEQRKGIVKRKYKK